MELLLVTSCLTTNKSINVWFTDSGCTNHMTHNRELFKELNKSNISRVKNGNGEQLALKCIETIAIKIHSKQINI